MFKKTHLVQIPTNILLNQYKKNTTVLVLVVFYELVSTTPRKLFKVLSCVIYTFIDRYVCIDYLGTEKKKISELRLGCTLKTRHEGMDYDNLFGIDVPDIFMNMLSCQGFLNSNDSIVILKCPNRMSQYYFNKEFIQLTFDESFIKIIFRNPIKTFKYHNRFIVV